MDRKLGYPMILSEFEEMSERIQQWAESPEGQAALKEAITKANEIIERLQKARQVTQEQLNEPITI